MATVAELLVECLRAAGVARVFGRSLPGIPSITADDPRLAALLADADGRLGPGPGAALLPNRTLRLSSKPGGAAERIVVRDPHTLPRAVHDASAPISPLSVALQLDLDLDADAPPEIRPRPADAAPPSGTLPVARGRVVVLAGPGVVRTGTVSALRDLAEAGDLGVLNTWGAKGVLPWDDPRHLGTAGLQADDFLLAGLADADLVVASGIDPDEASPAAIALAPVVAYDPRQLSVLARSGALRSAAPPERSDLFRRIAAIAKAGSAATKTPLHPARAVADLHSVLPAGGLVAGEAGPAGLWLARAFPTTEPSSLVVPATRAPGIAAALAFVAGLRGQRAIAVLDAPTRDETRAVVALAKRLAVPLVVEVWGPGGHVRDPDDHRARLQTALAAPGVTVLGVPVDASDTTTLLEAAGPVVAWGGLPAPGRP